MKFVNQLDGNTMTKYILNRLFHSALVMFTISFIVFFIMFKAGDPILSS